MKSSRRLGSFNKACFFFVVVGFFFTLFKCTNNSDVVGLITHVFKVIIKQNIKLIIYLGSGAEESSQSHFECVQTAGWAWSNRMGGVDNPEMGGEIKRQAFPSLFSRVGRVWF